MADLSSLSDQELMQIAGVGAGPDLSAMSDEDLMQIAGVSTAPSVDALIGEGTDGQRVGRAVVGGLSQFVPFMDRIVAGGSAAIDAGGNLLSGESADLSGAYNQRLGEVHNYQDAFNQIISEAPAADLLHKVGPALLLPFKSKVPERTSIFGKVATGTAETAALSGLLGVSQGRTPEEMAQKGWEGLETGAKWGGGLVGGLAIAQKAAQKTAPYFRGMGEASRRKAYGARSTDYSRSADDLGVYDIIDDAVETPVKAALDDLIGSGKLADPTFAGKVVAKSLQSQKALSTNIDDIIQAADDAGARAVPTFDNAVDYISNNVPADKVDDYLEKLSKYRDAVAKEGNGSLSYLQRQKITAGKEYELGNEILNGYHRAKYHDLQRTIEAAVPDVKPLNRELSKFKIVHPILKRFLSGDEASDIAGTAIQRMRTSGGNTVGPIIAGAAIGGGTGGAIGGALGVGVGALATPTGRKLTGDALIGLSKADAALSTTAGRVPKAVAAANSLGTERSAPANPQQTNRREPSVGRQGSQGRYFGPLLQDRKTQQTGGGEQTKLLQSSSNPASIFSKDQSLSEPSVFAKVLDAVKEVESSGDPKAIGPETKYGRAKGAYQFLDSTGKEYHKKLGIKEPYDPHNEPQQRKLAAAYITDLLEMFDGDMELALTAFHTGPGNVKKGKIGPIGRNYARSVFEKV